MPEIQGNSALGINKKINKKNQAPILADSGHTKIAWIPGDNTFSAV